SAWRSNFSTQFFGAGIASEVTHGARSPVDHYSPTALRLESAKASVVKRSARVQIGPRPYARRPLSLFYGPVVLWEAVSRIFQCTVTFGTLLTFELPLEVVDTRLLSGGELRGAN